MIDINKYEGCLADMKGYDLAILAEELIAEVKRLREGIERAIYDFSIVNENLNQYLKELIE